MKKGTTINMIITSLQTGGAERLVSELSFALIDDAKIQIILLTDKGISYPTSIKPVSLGISFKNKLGGILNALTLGVARYRRLIKKEIENEDTITSISFLILDNLVNILATRDLENVKTIVSVHIALSMKTKKWHPILRQFLGRLYNLSDLVVSVSYDVKKELMEEFNIPPEKIAVIYNPINISKIRELSKEEITDEPWFLEELPILINVGRLTPQKGQWHLIRAFKEVRSHYPCKLVIRGDGPLKEYLRNLVHELGLENDVKFIERKDNIFKYVANSEIFVMSSLYEALPYSIIEALACGVPVITTDCKYGPREILEEGKFGMLVPPMDGKMYASYDPLTPEEKALADKIRWLLENPKIRKRYSHLSKIRAQRFTEDHTIRIYTKLYSFSI